VGEIFGLDHVQLAMPAGQEPVARAFYGGVLGLAEEPKPRNLAVRGGVWFRQGACVFTSAWMLTFERRRRRIQRCSYEGWQTSWLAAAMLGFRQLRTNLSRASTACMCRIRLAIGSNSLNRLPVRNVRGDDE
jgi:hypothetical protein